jgi:hypothetical protein
MLVVTVAGVPVGAAAGGLAAVVGRERRLFWRGTALGLLGPLAGVVWVLFRWTVRIDPTTHYVGLYRPGVIAADMVAFLATGVGLGWLYRRVFTPHRGTSPLP